MPSQVRLLLASLGLSVCVGCGVETERVVAGARGCVDVRWPLAIPIGAGPAAVDPAGPYYPPRPCTALADCPPGAYCIDGPSGARCQTQPAPEVGGSLAGIHDVPRFEIEVVATSDGQRLQLSGVPALAGFALCSFYTCRVDAEILAEDPGRCLLDTVPIDLRAADGVVIPRASAASRAARVERVACETGEALKVTPTGFAAMCIAYRPSGVAAASRVIPLRPEQVGAIAGETYQVACTDATMGSACLHPRGGADHIGVCVGGYCCMACVASTATGSLLEQACASVVDERVEVPDARYIQMGHARYGVCFDGAGRPVCLEDGFIPADAPDGACVPRPEPRMHDPFAREYDEDGDGVSVDLDCDDQDPTRGAITFEATSDGIDQDCDGRVDEVTVRPCRDHPEMVAAWEGATCIDRYEASRPDATAVDAGRAVGPAVSRPGVMPWVDVTHPVAEAACRAAGKVLCDPVVVRQNCLHVSGSPFPYGPTYDPHGCNGAGGLFGDVVPTGTLSGCAGQSGAVDLVGNVAEWAADGMVLGGSFMSGSPDLSCRSARRYEPSDTPPDARFSAPWLGFRCCTAPPGEGE